MMYHSDASTELNSGSSPRSGKRFGNMPWETTPAQASKISRASSRWPVAMQGPRIAINVSAPIAEPGVAGDKGLSLAALDEIRVSGTFERTGEILPAALLDRPDLGMTRFNGFDVGDRVSFSREHQHRRFLGK